MMKAEPLLPATPVELPDAAAGTSLAVQLTPWLKQSANLSEGECNQILQLWQEQRHDTGLPQMLLKLGTVSAQELSVAISELLQLPLLSPEQHPEQPLCTSLSSEFLQRYRILPVAEDDTEIVLAMTDPSDELAVQSVQLACQKTVSRIVADDSILQGLFEQLYHDALTGPDEHPLDGSSSEQESGLDVEQLRDMASEAPVIRLVNQLIGEAVERLASDIHIEPGQHGLSVRLRCDGILHAVEAPPVQLATAIISRIKIMASLDIAERRLPQDGRINLRVQGTSLDIRVSTVPCVHGESVVMRLLRRERLSETFSELGLSADHQLQLTELLSHPNGLLVVSGPTGSGKTTTLYTALAQLNAPERKIITVEDPVEYRLPGINQIQVNSQIGLTFANALRTIVRQDPDTIMVGEMRDQEAAEICVQSALTGHLVLSTLHTNQAAGCITRLLEMGIADYLLTSTLRAVIGQRLVRRLCKHCAVPWTPEPEVQQTLLRASSLPDDTPTQFSQPGGCDHCNHSGYQGRIALMEILTITPRIQKMILDHADARQLHEAAVADGMITLHSDGCDRVISGQTSWDEVLRITGED